MNRGHLIELTVLSNLQQLCSGMAAGVRLQPCWQRFEAS